LRTPLIGEKIDGRYLLHNRDDKLPAHQILNSTTWLFIRFISGNRKATPVITVQMGMDYTAFSFSELPSSTST
jgi:hypothetical protein